MLKKPFINKEELDVIIRQFPTPFHLYDEEGIRKKVRGLQHAFAWNPGFKEFFAVKATPNPHILEILKQEDCGTDCSSLTELMLSEAVGIVGKNIMFSSNATPRDEYKLAGELGAIINLDDITHIDYLEDVCTLPKTICCRYNPGGLFSISTNIMDNPGDAKYGFTKEQMIEGFRKLKAKGVENFGIHAFLASNTKGSDYYPELARILFELAVELQQQTGICVDFVNLSGGIGIPYQPDEPECDINLVGEQVHALFDRILRPAGLEHVAIYTELGRYILGENGALVTTAIHEKHIYKEYIGVDASAVNLMRPAMYGAYHHITVMGKEDQPCIHRYDITGSLCENNDKFAIDRMLPQIETGDVLWMHDTGAHGFSMGYNYNGKLRSAEVLLESGGTVRCIRRAETPADYFTTLEYSGLDEVHKPRE